MPAVELPPAVDAERRELAGCSGRLSCHVAGEGTPVLLLHSVNAAASVYEVGPAFEQPRQFFAGRDAFLARPVPPRRKESA